MAAWEIIAIYLTSIIKPSFYYPVGKILAVAGFLDCRSRLRNWPDLIFWDALYYTIFFYYTPYLLLFDSKSSFIRRSPAKLFGYPPFFENKSAIKLGLELEYLLVK